MLYLRQILFNENYIAVSIILFNLIYTTILVILLNKKYVIFAPSILFNLIIVRFQ